MKTIERERRREEQTLPLHATHSPTTIVQPARNSHSSTIHQQSRVDPSCTAIRAHPSFQAPAKLARNSSFVRADSTMWSSSTLLLVALLGLVLLPASVSATAGPDTAAPSGAAGAVGGPAWAAPAAIIATLRSLSLALQSLFTRLATARLARGDLAGKCNLSTRIISFSGFKTAGLLVGGFLYGCFFGS